MRSVFHLKTLTLAFGFLVTAEMCQAAAPTVTELQDIVAELQLQNQSLQRGLTESNRAEKTATEQLAQFRQRLEALGKNLLDGADDRIVQAACDLQVASERLTKLESLSAQVLTAVNDYLRTGGPSDPAARLHLETLLRELDAALGMRQKPQPDIRSGSLQQARIVSLDPESGMMVLNLGENQGAKIGMSFRLTRGSQPYGKAILAEVRKGVSGAFIENLDKVTETPRPGDLAVIETQASAQ
jgi:flagellar basal body-associated protein FliL